MSSATSIKADAAPATLRPWQFFLLAGMLSATGVVIVATGQSPASIILLSLTVIAASLVALGAYRALAPLVLPESAVTPQVTVGRIRAGLEREKALALRSIKELEFDFAMGKITKSDFDEMSGKLRARAIGLMRQLDTGVGYRSAIEQELEERIAGLKSRATESSPATETSRATESSPATENSDVARDFSPATPPAMTICACGVANDLDARFCKGCGTRLGVVH